MAIDKNFNPLGNPSEAGLEIEVVNPDAISIETEDGGAIVILGPELSEQLDPGFNANLADHMDARDLGALGHELIDDFESEKMKCLNFFPYCAISFSSNS